MSDFQALANVHLSYLQNPRSSFIELSEPGNQAQKHSCQTRTHWPHLPSRILRRRRSTWSRATRARIGKPSGALQRRGGATARRRGGRASSDACLGRVATLAPAIRGSGVRDCGARADGAGVGNRGAGAGERDDVCLGAVEVRRGDTNAVVD